MHRRKGGKKEAKVLSVARLQLGIGGTICQLESETPSSCVLLFFFLPTSDKSSFFFFLYYSPLFILSIV
jgi:hypothetical protein